MARNEWYTSGLSTMEANENLVCLFSLSLWSFFFSGSRKQLDRTVNMCWVTDLVEWLSWHNPQALWENRAFSSNSGGQLWRVSSTQKRASCEGDFGGILKDMGSDEAMTSRTLSDVHARIATGSAIHVIVSNSMEFWDCLHKCSKFLTQLENLVVGLLIRCGTGILNWNVFSEILDLGYVSAQVKAEQAWIAFLNLLTRPSDYCLLGKTLSSCNWCLSKMFVFHLMVPL